MFLTILFTVYSLFQLEHISNPCVSGDFFDVVRADTLVYFVTGRGLEIYAWDDSNLVFVSRLSTDGKTCGIDIFDSYAYITDYKGLCIIDISNPIVPKQIGYFETSSMASDVSVLGDYAYVADWDNGLIILDISNSSGIHSVGHCSDIGCTYSITLVDTLVYIGSFDASLKVINVADPSHPFVIGEFPSDTSGLYGRDIFIDDTIAYINCYFTHEDKDINFAVVNIKEPNNPSFIAGLSLPVTNRGIEKLGNFIYTNTQFDGTCIINVTEPKKPCITNYYKETYWFGYGYDTFNNLLLVPQFLQGFSVVNISNPQEPTTIFRHKNVKWNYCTICDSLGYLYVLGEICEKEFLSCSILRILDISTQENPVICGELSLPGKGSLFEASIDYPYLAITIRQGHPKNESLYTAIVDVSDPYKPQFLKYVPGGGVNILNLPYLYFLTKNKIMKLDINNPNFWSDSLSLSTEAFDMVINDSTIYVTVAESLVILDITSGNQIGSYFHGKPYAVNISLDYPYLAIPYTPFSGSSYGFMIFDISNYHSPTLLTDTLIHAPAVDPQTLCIVGCELDGNFLYFGRGDYGFDIWKIEFPDSIYKITTQDTPNLATHCYPFGNSNIYIKDNILFLMDYGSLEIYKLTNP